jgi:hypothetical protein
MTRTSVLRWVPVTLLLMGKRGCCRKVPGRDDCFEEGVGGTNRMNQRGLRVSGLEALSGRLSGFVPGNLDKQIGLMIDQERCNNRCGMVEKRIDWEAQANNGKEMAEAGGDWESLGVSDNCGAL